MIKSMANASRLLACADINNGAIGLERKISIKPQDFVGIGLANGHMHQEMIEIISRDEVLLIEANAISKLPVHRLWN